MVRLNNIKTKERPDPASAPRAASAMLGMEATEARLLRCSVDARHGDVRYVWSAAFAVPDEARALALGAERYEPGEGYVFPFSGLRTAERPVVAGMGPAGLFAALCLAEAGVPCTVLERGREVERRREDVHRYWSGGPLDT
jgi:uncharacterized FAD-dependent dehydrogenase